MNLPYARVLIVSLITAAMTVVACGGDEELTLEEYFERVTEIADSRDAETDELEQKFDELEENEVDAFSGLVGDMARLTRDAFKDMDGLNPPAEAEAAHDEFVSAGFAMSDAFDEVVEELGDAESMEDAFGVMSDTPDLQAAEERSNNACAALQAVADDAGIDADMDC